jgi:hypothetical protein
LESASLHAVELDEPKGGSSKSDGDGGGVGGGALGGAPTMGGGAESGGGGGGGRARPEQARNASPQAASEQEIQPGELESSTHCKRQFWTVQ